MLHDAAGDGGLPGSPPEVFDHAVAVRCAQLRVAVDAGSEAAAAATGTGRSRLPPCTSATGRLCTVPHCTLHGA
jgi:hypothetical protein